MSFCRTAPCKTYSTSGADALLLVFGVLMWSVLGPSETQIRAPGNSPDALFDVGTLQLGPITVRV